MDWRHLWTWVGVVCLFCAAAVCAPQDQVATVGSSSEPTAGSSAAAVAAVPRLIKFSGEVRDARGERLGSVAVRLTFAVYEEQQGGAALWAETQMVELDEQGQYSVLLGATRSDGVPVELFPASKARWLGVQVEGRDEDPRVLLVSVPYALKAEDAAMLGGRRASEFALAEQLKEEVRTQVEAQKPGATRSVEMGGIAAPLSVEGTGTTNLLAKWLDTIGTLGDSAVFESGGNVGIGTTSPNANNEPYNRLTVAGNDDTALAMGIENAGIGHSALVIRRTGGTASRWLQYTPSGSTDLRLYGDGDVVTFQAGGNVGIGTTAPGEKLEVAGNVKASGSVTAASFSGNGAGLTNVPAGTVTSVGSGTGLTGGPITTTGTLSLDTTFTDARYAALLHGHTVSQVSGAATTGANSFTGDQSITGNLTLSGSINGGLVVQQTGGATPNVIGGYNGNTVANGVSGATISGGGAFGHAHSISVSSGTIGGGYSNTVSSEAATVAGGHHNTASGDRATIGGGREHTASGSYATVGGGIGNTASGNSSTVSGGQYNTAQGPYSFAAGRRAKALHDGAFVWGDSADEDVVSTGGNQFVVRATGGAFFSNDLTAGRFIGNGSGLTNVPAGTANDLNCTGCVEPGELNFDPATQTELDTESTARASGDITLSGALDSHKGSGDHDGRYARLVGGNSFDGSQVMSADTAGLVLRVTQSGSGRAMEVSSSAADKATLRSVNDGSAGFGLQGVATATTGYTYGVLGETSSPQTRAVLGLAYATTGSDNSGVQGESNSTEGVGVRGVAHATSGPTVGVHGTVHSADGTAGVFYNVAGGRILRGLVGEGAPATEVFRVEGSGNVWTSGSVTATSFSGDGSGLTNVPAGTATDLNCLGCVAASELAFDPATQTELDAEASLRGAADTALQSNISSEASTRAARDNALSVRGINYLAGCDTCSVLTDADDQRTIYANVIGPMTINSVTCFSDAGTPTMNIQRDDGTPANILSSDLTCSTAGATSTSFSGSENTLDLNHKLDFAMVTAGGSAKRVTVVVKATLN
jgi:hypothetical protein